MISQSEQMMTTLQPGENRPHTSAPGKALLGLPMPGSIGGFAIDCGILQHLGAALKDARTSQN